MFGEIFGEGVPGLRDRREDQNEETGESKEEEALENQFAINKEVTIYVNGEEISGTVENHVDCLEKGTVLKLVFSSENYRGYSGTFVYDGRKWLPET